MRFLNKNNSGLCYGDHRVIQKFAILPTRVLDYKSNEEYTVWFEKYDSVQKYYLSAGWGEIACAILGTGSCRAIEGAKLYHARFIHD
jgi:hypothetical protein